MKKYILLICSIIFAFGQTTCVDEGMEFDTYGGKGIAFVHFVGSSITLSTELEELEDAPHSATITISSTAKSDQARTYTLQVDPFSKAIEGTHYNLSSKTVTIPAGQYSGSVTISVIIENLVKPVLDAVFTIDSDDAIDYGKKLTVFMNRYDLCEFEEEMLVGTFNYASEDWAEWGVLTLTADPDDPYKIYINGPPSEDLDWNENPVELNVNPNDFTLSGPRCIVAEKDWYGRDNLAFEALEGIFDFCAESYTIIFKISVNQGTYGEYEFVFSK